MMPALVGLDDALHVGVAGRGVHLADAAHTTIILNNYKSDHNNYIIEMKCRGVSV